MRQIIAAVALTILPLVAGAQALGNAAGCDRVAGREESSDNLFVLWPNQIERWESRCEIVQIDGDLNLRSLITASCSGEGDTWEQVYGMTPVGGDVFTIWPVESPELITELRLCE
ncbi:hypothetical protein L0664_00560 [Octadecabacter sp. G9-8]|uniref:Uncharacterized protein n=1 Tax=Octadecabacter dasysiphoniae TaxID=2909341 RepID=A0ABS9CS21_9RHOB|nr:hypothetical protein [Octadecabacter dasysiphoniae]MCF2869542.1 hypothetical protein [Octadecabacter dasysiphoniae]